MAVIEFRNPRGQGQDNQPFDTPDWEEGSSEYGEYGEPEEAYSIQEDRNPRGSLDYDDTADRRRRRSLLRTVGVTALGILAAVVLGLLIRDRTYSRASFNNVADYEALDAATYCNLDGCILAYSRDGASCMDDSGKKIWNLTYEMQQPIISIDGGVAAIGDYNGSIIYLVNKEKTLNSVNTNMPIRALCVSESGEVAAVLDDTDVTWIYLYGSDSEPIAYFKTTMKQSGYPLSVSISPNGELVGVSFLMSENSRIKTSIAFYNFGAVGQNALENNVSAFNFDEEVFPYIHFINSDTLIAVSDSRIAFFKGNQIPQNGANNMFKENLEGVFCGQQYTALLFPDTTGEYQYEIQVFDANGEKTGTIRFTMDYTSIQVARDRIIVNNDTDCMIFSVTGKKRYEGKFDANVRILIPSENPARMTLVTSGAVERMTLQ